jgi:hypothetical protein
LSRIYAVPFTGTVTAAGTDTDLWSFQPADDKPIKLAGFRLSQISEVGDAQEEGLRITVRRMTATFTVGSGGGSVTAAAPPGDSAEPAWTFTARTNDTTVATTSGTNQVTEELGWNERNSPYEMFYPDPKFYTKARQTEAIVIRMETTLADDMTFTGTAWIEEE